jgi:hypothetical protein
VVRRRRAKAKAKERRREKGKGAREIMMMVQHENTKHLESFPYLARQLKVVIVLEGEHESLEAEGMAKKGVPEVINMKLILVIAALSEDKGESFQRRKIHPAQGRGDMAFFEEGEGEAAEGAEL